jgi:hypothetical protein
MTVMARVGTSRRINVKDLTLINADGTETPITVGATVTITVLNPDGSTYNTGTATASGDDWSRIVTMPSIPGKYQVKVTAVASGATEEWIDDIWVRAF